MQQNIEPWLVRPFKYIPDNPSEKKSIFQYKPGLIKNYKANHIHKRLKENA